MTKPLTTAFIRPGAALLLLLGLAACGPSEGAAALAEARSALPEPVAAPVPAPDAAPAGEDGLTGGGAAGATVQDASSLSLLLPVLSGLSLDTHSLECDPFDDPYEVCL